MCKHAIFVEKSILLFTIGGNIVRGSEPRTYPVGTQVFKYENSGVNLNRINTTHNLNNVTQLNPFTFDSYKVKIDMSATTGTDRSTDIGHPKLYIGQFLLQLTNIQH